ncbi:MAG: SDR family NAD(P)-dependent oxidoreductase [Dehalococcoidia bacterium]
MKRFESRTAMVTGGARGLGRAIAIELAKEGADLVIGDLLEDEAERTAIDIRGLGRRALSLRLDVTDAGSIQDGISRAVDFLGRINVLVNNAGVGPEHLGAEVEGADWDLCYRVNLRGVWAVSTAVAPHMRAGGGGRIVNISSVAGRQGGTGLAPYSASKAGCINLTQSLAASLGRHNINVNAVCPGLIWTDMWRKTEGQIQGDHDPEVVNRRQAFEAAVASTCLLGREQTPEDVARAVCFFASDDAKNVTGQALNVDGGIRLN